ncbi:MAG: fructosamine kinase family protein [Candidatus Sumerlaeaceae bacterium]|nr:fructosamine kinase family protein [Candidatus Sumerlaeaceae bacterium]
MIPDPLRRAAENVMAAHRGQHESVVQAFPVGGGCISNGTLLRFSSDRFAFLKWNWNSPARMFHCEAAGLKAMRPATSLRIPEVYGVADATDLCPPLILMEAANTGKVTPRSGEFDDQLAQGLAKLHSATSQTFGFSDDNFIGPTPQPNPSSKSWPEFFCEHRLNHMLNLLTNARAMDSTDRRTAARFAERVTPLLQATAEAPSLLHGDLWGGNVLATDDGLPALIDPACYYGHREADLAMTQLFGGFSPRFCAAYREVHPLQDGYGDRFEIYNVYHLLNHALLFGGGYLAQAMTVMKRFAG